MPGGDGREALAHDAQRHSGYPPVPEVFQARLHAALGSLLYGLSLAVGNRALGTEWERRDLRGPFQPKPFRDTKGAYGTPAVGTINADCNGRTGGNGSQLKERRFTLDVSKRLCPLRGGGAQEKVTHRN